MKMSIKKKFTVSILIFIMILDLCIGMISSYFAVQRTMNRYEMIGKSVTGMIADKIDGDSIQTYLETNIPDKQYEELLSEINIFQKEFDILSLYIVVPEAKKLKYVWESGYSGEEAIGFESDYSPGGEQWVKEIMHNSSEKRMKSFRDPVYGYSATIASIIPDSSGQPVALVMADFSMSEINATIWKLVLNISIFSILFSILIIWRFTVYGYKKFVHPIISLTDSAENMIQNLENNEPYHSNIHTGDELEKLSVSFEKMDCELRTYIAENTKIAAEKERIGAELDMAKNIQAGQLPSKFPAFPDRTEFDIYASMTPAKEVGGDFYDFFFTDNDHLVMVIADVSGKGVPAALFMMASKILINNYAMMGLSAHEILERTNETICKNNQLKMFVTVWIGILEISTKKVTAANAGHEYPILRQPNGKFEIFKDKHGFVIGGIKGKKYKEYEFTMQKGSTLFVYTDGVPEATNANEELFNMERLVETLNQKPDAMPQQLLINVHEAVNAFVGDAPQFDDLTMLAVTLL